MGNMRNNLHLHGNVTESFHGIPYAAGKSFELLVFGIQIQFGRKFQPRIKGSVLLRIPKDES